MKKIILKSLIVMTLICLTMGFAYAATTTTDNNVKSISFTPAKPVEFIENAKGEKRIDAGGKEYYYYYLNALFTEGDRITVTDNSGQEKEYTYKFVNRRGYVFASTDGEVLDNLFLDDDQLKTHWTVGNTYSATVEYMGATTSVPVTVKENPVKSISFTPVAPVKIVENTKGMPIIDSKGKQFYFYNLSSLLYEGNILTVEDREGNKKNYTSKYVEGRGCLFTGTDGETIADMDIWINDNQFEKHWKAGNTYSATVEYMGATTSVPVTIKESSQIKSVKNTSIKAKSTAGKGYIKISWKKSGGSKLDGYKIYRKQSGQKQYKLCKTLKSSNATTYKNTNLKSKVKYYYYVRGYKKIGGMTYYTKASLKVSSTLR